MKTCLKKSKPLSLETYSLTCVSIAVSIRTFWDRRHSHRINRTMCRDYVAALRELRSLT